MNDATTTKPRRQREGRGKKPTTTALQDRALFLIKKNLFSSNPKPLPDLLLEAGYAPESVRQWTNIWLGLKPHVDPVVQKMEDHREKVLARLDDGEIFDRATYSDLMRGLQITTQNIRLLTGKSTHNFAIDATLRSRLDELLS